MQTSRLCNIIIIIMAAIKIIIIIIIIPLTTSPWRGAEIPTASIYGGVLNIV